MSSHFDWEVLLAVLVVLLSFALNHWTHSKHLEWLPEGGTTIILGIIIGALDYAGGSEMRDLIRLNSKFFSSFLLPPIIFDAGFALRKKDMFRNFGTIMLLAVFGTLISNLIVGFGAYAYLNTGVDHDAFKPYNAYGPLMFGALISATDPVASLAVLANVFKVSEKPHTPLIYSLIFGESVFNDAVSIVLYRSFKAFLDKPYDGVVSIFEFVGEFLLVSVASIAIGAAVAIMTSLIFKYVNLRENYPYELFVLLLMSYCSYIISEALEFSGILSIFVCGIAQRHYSYRNVSFFGQLSQPRISNALANICETFIFAFLGFAFFAFYDSQNWDVSFIFLALGLCFGSRAVSVLLLCGLANLKRSQKVSWRQMIVLWFAGLRGAIAFSLAVAMTNEPGVANGELYLSTTLVIIVFTTFVCGGLTAPLLRFLKLSEEEPQADAPKSNVEGWDARYIRPILNVKDPIVITMELSEIERLMTTQNMRRLSLIVSNEQKAEEAAIAAAAAASAAAAGERPSQSGASVELDVYKRSVSEAGAPQNAPLNATIASDSDLA